MLKDTEPGIAEIKLPTDFFDLEGNPISPTFKPVSQDRCFGDINSFVRPFLPLTAEVLKDPERIAQLPEVEILALKLGIEIFTTGNDARLFYAPPTVDLNDLMVQDFIDRLNTSMDVA